MRIINGIAGVRKGACRICNGIYVSALIAAYALVLMPFDVLADSGVSTEPTPVSFFDGPIPEDVKSSCHSGERTLFWSSWGTMRVAVGVVDLPENITSECATLRDGFKESLSLDRLSEVSKTIVGDKCNSSFGVLRASHDVYLEPSRVSCRETAKPLGLKDLAQTASWSISCCVRDDLWFQDSDNTTAELAFHSNLDENTPPEVANDNSLTTPGCASASIAGSIQVVPDSCSVSVAAGVNHAVGVNPFVPAQNPAPAPVPGLPAIPEPLEDAFVSERAVILGEYQVLERSCNQWCRFKHGNGFRGRCASEQISCFDQEVEAGYCDCIESEVPTTDDMHGDTDASAANYDSNVELDDESYTYSESYNLETEIIEGSADHLNQSTEVNDGELSQDDVVDIDYSSEMYFE